MPLKCFFTDHIVLTLVLVAYGGKDENEESIESPYADMELCAQYAIKELKSVLKNPSSLIVNNLYAVEADDYYIFDIDYSAENGFGGMTRNDLFIAIVSTENGYGVHTYGTKSFAEATNQRYSSQFFAEYKKTSGAYIFDLETYQVIGTSHER